MRTLRLRLLVTVVATFALVALLMLVAAQRQMQETLRGELAKAAARFSTLLGAAAAPLVAENDVAGLNELVRSVVGRNDVAYVTVVDNRQRTLAQSGPAGPAQRAAPAAEALPAGTPGGDVDALVERDGVFHFAHPLALNGRPYGVLHFGLSTAAVEAASTVVIRRLATIGVAGLLLALLLHLVLLRMLTRRLQALVDGAGRLEQGGWGVQLPVDGEDETATLTRAFNRMSAAVAERVSALEDARARQQSLVDALTEGVVFHDADGTIVSCNEAGLAILGLARAQLVGTRVADFRWPVLRPDGSAFDLAEHPATLALRSGQPVRDTVLGVDRPGHPRLWLLHNVQPLLRPGESRPYAAVTSFADVTARIEARNALQQANEALEARVQARTTELAAARDAAEAASRAKSEFLSRMSHELRTPLNAILGFAQVLRLRLKGREPGVDEQLAHVETAGWHLLELINDVLDLSRIESGSVIVSDDVVELAPLVAECVRMTGALAASNAVAVDDGGAARPGVFVRADRTRLRQVLVNLLSNAIKYNRRDGRVTLTVTPAAGDEGDWQIAIADTGIGLTPAQLASLYQPFNRLGAEGGAVEGTGIGLVITQRLVQLMGGALDVRSTPGEGSCFTVRLRRGAPQAPPAPASAPVPLDGAGAEQRLLLYVEDNPSNVQLLSDVLALRPAVSMVAAADGPAGLAAAQQRRPDVIVVDIALPGMDGYTLCRRLRAMPGLRGVPIVALSANAMARDRALGLEAGFDEYMTKPLDVAQFLRWLDRTLGAAPA